MKTNALIFTILMIVLLAIPVNAAEFGCKMSSEKFLLPECGINTGPKLLQCEASSGSGAESDIRWRLYDPITADVLHERLGSEYSYSFDSEDWMVLEARMLCGNGFFYWRWLTNIKGFIAYNEDGLKHIGMWEMEKAKVTYVYFKLVDIATNPLIEEEPPDWAKHPQGKTLP